MTQDTNPNRWPKTRAQLLATGYQWPTTTRKLSTCRKCGTAIIWVQTPRGKRMPLEWARPVDKNPQLDLFQSHFSSCPYPPRRRTTHKGTTP